jgi:hypothetical protein
MAEEVLLGGQRVTPARAMTSGFRFAYPKLKDALEAIAPPKQAPVRTVRPNQDRVLSGLPKAST